MRFVRYAPVISAFFMAALAAVAPAQENVWTSHGPTGVGWVSDVAVGDSAAVSVAESADGNAFLSPLARLGAQECV